MRRIPKRSVAATFTIRQCGAAAAGCGRASVKRHRTQDGSPWVRSLVFLFERAVDSKGRQIEPPNSQGAGLSVPVVTSDTLVVDVAPEVAVVLGVGNGDLLARLLHG